MTSSNLGNPPGLPVITYHSGTHATFLRRMLDRLNTQTVPSDTGIPPLRPLAVLTTRESDDPTIALLDAWATVADTLSFYQDRIANEGYLRTATERRSVLELTRAVGFELSPGVAADVLLAFEVDDSPGSPLSADVPKGTKVQSIPTQGQMPQTFETSKTLTAWAALNSFRPSMDEAQAWAANSAVRTLLVTGTAHNLRSGDYLLLVPNAPDEPQLVQIEKVDRAADCTRINLAEPPAFGNSVSAHNLGLFVFRRRAALFGSTAPQKPVHNVYDFLQHYNEWAVIAEDPEKQALQEQKKSALDVEYAQVISDHSRQEWELVAEDKTPGTKISLDSEYAQVTKSGWVAIIQSEKPDPQIHQVVATDAVSRSDYGMTTRVTQLTLDGEWVAPQSMAELRTAVVYLQSEQLSLSKTTPLMPSEMPELILGPEHRDIPLDIDFAGQEVSGTFIVTGQTTKDKEISEAVDGVIKENNGQITLSLKSGLQNQYQRDTITIHGNVVHASHGETVSGEVLGSGNASQTNQRFVLRHTPLTYVAAATASGGASTLSIRVNGLLWDEVPSLLNQGATRRCYTLQRDNRGRTIVIFGDGVSGARLPTGIENVIAAYRYGLGTDGNVAVGALTLLQTRPHGIRSVSNPIAASGGAAPATEQEARTLGPPANLPMGRLVSLADYAHFARTFAGIGKAEAKLVQRDGNSVVCITIAAENGGQIPAESELCKNLLGALRSHGNPLNRVELVPYLGLTFGMTARVLTDPRFRRPVVLDAIRAKLKENYSFERRNFSQELSSTELITDIQTVPGVLAVDLVKLYLDVDVETAGNVGLENFTVEVFHAFLPLDWETWIAQLLIINPENIHLEKWT